MISIGVLGTARIVPYGLLEPAKAEDFAARHGIQRAFCFAAPRRPQCARRPSRSQLMLAHQQRSRGRG